MSRTPYAATSDVESLLSGVVLSATSRPTASQVANLLVLASNELDSMLGLVDYSVPIPTSATASIEMARSWTSIGAAYKTAMSMPQGKESKHAEVYGAEWRAILQGIEAGQRYLPDAAREGSKMPRHAEADTADPEGNPVFTRAESQTLR
jgi:hypothetical protein